jgi:DNA-binding LacI/PurR family transcriptional regulator
MAHKGGVLRRSNDPRVTISSMARRLSLSPTTVATAINGSASRYGISEATVARVKAEAARLNYRPNAAARQLTGKRSNTVGVLITTDALADPRLIQRMEILAAERGIRFLVGHVVSGPARAKDYLDDFHGRGIDAVISIFHNHPDYQEIVRRELSRFERVVYYERPAGDLRAGAADVAPCYVQPDFYEAGRLAVQHLVDRGRRRIGLALDNVLFPYGEAWKSAYRDVLQAAGLPVEDGLFWVMDRRMPVRGIEPLTTEAAARAVDDLVLAGGADAVVTCRDSDALRIMAALHRRGRRVPDDVALVGCDNAEVGTCVEPQLTTVDLRVDDLARAVVEILFQMLDDDAVPQEHRAAIIKPELIVRQST